MQLLEEGCPNLECADIGPLVQQILDTLNCGEEGCLGLVDDIIAEVCEGRPVEECVPIGVGIIEAVIEEACEGRPLAECVDLTAIVSQLCNGYPIDQCRGLDAVQIISDIIADVCGPGLLLECLATVEGIVAGIIEARCPNLGCPQEVADDVIALVSGVIEEVCGPGLLLECAAKAEAIVMGALEAVREEACPTATSDVDCLNQYIDSVYAIVDGVQQDVHERVCGYESTTMCVDTYEQIVIGAVNGAIATVRETACQDATSDVDCANQYINWVYGIVDATVQSIHRAVCGTQSTHMCADTYEQVVIGAVNGAIATVRQTACPGAASDVDCANQYIDWVYGIVDTTVQSVHRAVCGEQSTTMCVDTYEQVVIGAVNGAIATVRQTACPSATSDVDCINEYVAWISGILQSVVEAVHEEICGTQSTTTCVDSYEQVVLGVVNGVLMQVCQSTHPGTCATNLADEIDDSMGALCTATSLPDGGDTTGVPPGVGTCLVKLVGAVNLILTTVCDSTSAATCAANLIDKIDDTLWGLCTGLPGTTDFTTTGVPPGVATCLQKGVASVEQIVVTVCQSTNPSVCVNNLIDKIDDTLWGLCTATLPGTTDFTTTGVPPGVATCLQQGVATVEQILLTACQTTDPSVCVTNLIDKIDDTVWGLCTATLPGGTTDFSTMGLPPGVATCLQQGVASVEQILRTVCQSTDPSICVNNLIDRIDDTLWGLCTGLPGTTAFTSDGLPPGVATCLQKGVATAEGLVHTMCPSEIDTCIEENRDWLVSIVVGLITSLKNEMCPEGDEAACAAQYRDQVIEIADGLVADICPGGIEACPTEKVNELKEIVEGIVTGIKGQTCPEFNEAVCALRIRDELLAFLDGLLLAQCPGGIESCENLVGTLLQDVCPNYDCVPPLCDPCVSTPAWIDFDRYYEALPLGATANIGFTVYDGFEQPVGDSLIPWVADISGPNGPQTFSGLLDLQGRGGFSYMGGNAGVDSIRVTVGAASQTAQRSFDRPEDSGSSGGGGGEPQPPPEECASDCPNENDQRTFEELAFEQLLLSQPHCPPPVNGESRHCIDEGPFDDNQPLATEDSEQGDGIPDSQGTRWRSDAFVDFHGCAERKRNRCHNYEYQCGDTKCTNPGYSQHVGTQEETQRNRIFPDAKKVCAPDGRLREACKPGNPKVDVGIVASFEAFGGEWYRAVVNARISQVGGGGDPEDPGEFYARLTVVPRAKGGQQIDGTECNAKLKTRGEWITFGLLIQLPFNKSEKADVNSVSIKYRAHSTDADGNGTPHGIASLAHVRFRQVPTPSDPDRPKRVDGECYADGDGEF